MPPSGSQPPSRARRFFNLVLFVALLAVGGAALVPVYRWLHPSAGTTPVASASSAASAASASHSARATPSSTASAASGDRAGQKAGVLFDDFHYTGADDPALAAHGWRIRTRGGGPGITSTWTASGVGFPTARDAQGKRVLQLQTTTDGSRAGTRQSELTSSDPRFRDGTYAARIYFTDGPVLGSDGDHISEAFYAISPSTASRNYSELDFEYMPNGGWGSKRPELDTTSWRTAKAGDRVYHPAYQRLHGWHTMRVVALHGRVSYYIDDTELFSSHTPYALHGPVDVAFSTWLIDLPFTGKRTWNMQVNWFYYQAGKAVSLSGVRKSVDGYYAGSTHYVNTLAGG